MALSHRAFVGLQCVLVIFSDHTYLLFLSLLFAITSNILQIK